MIHELGDHCLFGCFSEAMCLTIGLSDKRYSDEIRQRDWFLVNPDNMEFINRLFSEFKLTTQSPKSFGKDIDLPDSLNQASLTNSTQNEDSKVLALAS